MVTASNDFRMGANEQHVLASQKRADDRFFDLAMFCNGAHFEVISYNQMPVAEFFAQEFGYDALVERGGLYQSAGGFLLNIDVGKTAVADHDTANAIIS